MGEQILPLFLFRGELLVPVVENLLCRAKAGWDDYDNDLYERPGGVFCIPFLQERAKDIYGNFNLFSMI